MSAAETIQTKSGFPLHVERRADGEQAEMLLQAPAGRRCVLHWGVRRRPQDSWHAPSEASWPAGTQPFDSHAVQSPFSEQNGGEGVIIRLGPLQAFSLLDFVLFFPEKKSWDNNGGRNYEIVLSHPDQSAGLPLEALRAQLNGDQAGIADDIIRAETTHNSWTLMHRFNLCHDFLERAGNDVHGLALLYVWMRFSAVRQLTWQRNYNTKPRELAHAQDRLTRKLTEIFQRVPGSRPLARLTLATVGRGGEVHRHHIKEVSGHFLEEWHQKLHNNTTPDDVVICEGYLEFLRSNGNRDRFYEVLENAGVTRQRLESFERPIRSSPDFVPHLKDGLLHDFYHFLRILKASHSGTDLETAINAARGKVDGQLHGLLDHLWRHRDDPPGALVDLVGGITEARRKLSEMTHGDGLRELLYLDLALEQLLRGAIERSIHQRLGGDQLADLIARVLENLTVSAGDPELGACSRHWYRLQSVPRFGPDWALHAKSVVDRVGRALGGWMDGLYQLLQPKAEILGRGFHAESWSITIFSEEVVRGSSLGFVLSMLLRHLDPLLRKAARIGDWQIVSRGHGAGQVRVVASLQEIQRMRFEMPTIIVADRISGEEEIPEGVTAVIAPDVTDIVSHVAVRARNAGVLFASCHDADALHHLKSFEGRRIRLEVSPAGDVDMEETTGDVAEAPIRERLSRPVIATPRFTRYAVGLGEFNERVVGGKSCHQASLKGRLPDWIKLPPSVALPFGVFERVLELGENREIATRCRELLRQADEGNLESLAPLRETVRTLAAPEELKTALTGTMAGAGLAVPADWDKTWSRIKQVWASKWNERAFLSRRKMGMPNEQLFMAVLIQAVVESDYAFVIHTVNPSTGNSSELFAEVVLGLGETLVGNYPGRALSFVCDKSTGQPTLLSYPGKSVALYGGGLIFRSDSNGEDLAGFAGAGLYDSVLLDPPREAFLDYSREPLVWDEAFRQALLTAIFRIGLEVERTMGSPQDIEGAVSKGVYHIVQTRPQVGLK
jgi:alpha-glucan,water dikinase